MKRPIIFFLLLTGFITVHAQRGDLTFKPSIHTVKLYKAGDVYSYPLINLNSPEQLELHFDDFDADIKNFYYSFQLCNADWSPANLQSMDYIRGFQSNRITNYRNSSIAGTRYTHYQVTFPERSMVPFRSGNYLLKVFRNNDTTDLFFTKRFLVVDNKLSVASQIRQPFKSRNFLTDQRIHVIVNTATSRLNVMSGQDIKLVVLQNNIWTTSAFIDKPTIFRGNYFEYDDDYLSFQAGSEWRRADLRSMRLLGDRSARMVDDSIKGRTDIWMQTDITRKNLIYRYDRDLNGIYTIENVDGYNPYWQSDFAYIHFSFEPPGRQPYAGRDVYVYGELTNYLPNEESKMQFNRETGLYEKTLLLKQGFYNYTYVTMDAGGMKDRFSLENTEGNFNNTENVYTILVYYRPFGGRADELLGFGQLNSLVR